MRWKALICWIKGGHYWRKASDTKSICTRCDKIEDSNPFCDYDLINSRS